MDLRGVVEDVTGEVFREISDVLATNISPTEKENQIVRVFLAVGREFGDQLLQQVNEIFDSAAIRDAISINDEGQVWRLAQKIVRDFAFEETDSALVKEYFDVLLGRAEETAFRNAKSLEKHPTLTRRATGKETCSWCEARTGTFTDPDGELFRRHDNCDCIFKVSGFKSRNGVLKNYRKKGASS